MVKIEYPKDIQQCHALIERLQNRCDEAEQQIYNQNKLIQELTESVVMLSKTMIYVGPSNKEIM